MKVTLGRMRPEDLGAALEIWNEVVLEGVSFPGDQPLSLTEAEEMFAAQTAVVCAKADGRLAGLYILHPNNIGRCSQIANASYGVKKEYRGCGIGRRLVRHSLETAKENRFLGLQFNAVVCTNFPAIRLYIDLGFEIIGTIPNGYRLPDGSYTNTLIFYKSLCKPME